MPSQLITVSDAREQVLAATPRLESELIAVIDALGRVLAEDVVAAGDTPPFACSAMDGYAIHSGPQGRELEIVGESRAGTPATIALAAGQAIRISTGAVVPGGADAVIRQEDAERRDGRIVTAADTRQGENVRHAGEDMRRGTRVLEAGARVGAAELAAAVAAGAGAVQVARRPRVQVLATGDELREPGAPLAPGQIHNSNGPMLLALARGAGAESARAGVLPDDREATTAELRRALDDADVLLVSGGVSVGPHDHVKPALQALGVRERFWRVALQPGKPTWFGTRGDTLVFGLPGNPVSAFVTFVLFAAPALAALQGGHAPTATGHARLAEPVARSADREQAVRVRLETTGDGLMAVPNGPQASHIVTSLLGADGLAMIAPGKGVAQPGERVPLIKLSGSRSPR